MFILDHIENLQLDENREKGHFNEIRSLEYLAHGLEFLYNQVNKEEEKLLSRLPKNKRTLIMGNALELSDVPQDLIACAFHWYAVSVCNYVKLVGWLTNNGDATRAREYMERVLLNVYVWRHKIGAHFAIIDPRTNDNAADLVNSMLFPICFDNDAFYANSLNLIMKTGGKISTNRKDMSWSLSHIHRELIPRYWV